MNKKKLGFTMIEVAIFLVITGALFVGIAVGTQNSIFQQRYNDAVQNFAEFLRSAYSQTMNVESEGDGRSKQAIYGKLVTFGEKYDLAGELNDNDSVFSYNVIGSIDEEGLSGNILVALNRLNANVVTGENGLFRPVGYAEDYNLRWASAIQQKGSKDNFVGALLIVRHPSSGTVYTFAKEGETVEVNKAIKEAKINGATALNPLKAYLNGESTGGFKAMQMDFCVNPNGKGEGGLRRDVRIVKNARNGSGVEIISEGAGDLCGNY